MDGRGLFIVLEGSDGSGKTTQFKLLTERLRAVGHNVAVFDFPRYDEPSSYFVKRYLNGDYGPASEVSPYTASLFYALDRFEAASDIKNALAQRRIVLANRYVGSNMAHQGSKFGSLGEQRGFFIWEESLEYQLLDIPRPAINIYLRVPAETAFRLIGQKSARTYTVETRDQHEADIEHLKKTVQTYDLLCQLFTQDFKSIECAPEGQLLKVTEISDLIWQALKPLLPPPTHVGRKRVVRLESPIDFRTAKTQTPRRQLREPTVSKPEILKFEVKDVSLLAAGEIMASEGIRIRFMSPWPKRVKAGVADFYVPKELTKKQLSSYQSFIRQMSSIYARIQVKTVKQAFLQPLLPLATLADIEINGSAAATQNLLAHLSGNELSEARDLAKRLQQSLNSWLSAGSSDIKIDREPPDKKRQHLIKELLESHLPHGILREDGKLRLLEAWPRNEFELLADSLYPLSDIARDDILASLDKLTYSQKQKALGEALLADASQLLSKVHYRFDVLADMFNLLNTYASGIVSALQLQIPTIRYGYQIPKAVEGSDNEDSFVGAFDESLKLFGVLQSENSAGLESYAVLLGHKQRWQFSTNGTALLAYWQSKRPTEELFLSDEMSQKIAENHPLISAFLNQPKPPPAAVLAKKPSTAAKLSKKKAKTKQPKSRSKTRRK